tara:strand:- start:2941 stop:3135 length:195 start_codon:yes stop_codon:yes gene_type:complete
MASRFKKVPRDNKTGVPKKYLSGAKDKLAKAKEMKRTAAAYKAGKKINVKAVSKSRTRQNGKAT